MAGLRGVRAAACAAAVTGTLALLGGTPREASAAAGSADYTVTVTSGLYESPPANATNLGFASSSSSKRVDLPFLFPYFGTLYDHITAVSAGYVLFGNDSAAGLSWTSSFSPPSPGTSTDGLCAPVWHYYTPVSSPGWLTWTAGTAPNRRFVVGWENVNSAPVPGVSQTFQVKFHEGSGRIEFAYKPDTTPSTWGTFTYAVGMDAPGYDARYVCPVSTAGMTGHPANDYQMDPVLATVTGSLAYERRVPGPSGLEAQSLELPLGPMRVDLRYADGRLAATGTTDRDGSFSLTSALGPSGDAWEIRAVTETPLCTVRPPGGAAPFVSPRLGTPLASNRSWDVGALLCGADEDGPAAFRGPANVALGVSRLLAWASARTADTIPPLGVSFGSASTAYTRKVGTTAASLAVAGSGAQNEDTWDDAVVASVLGRHVLESVNFPQAAAPDPRLTVVTTEREAFATAFGIALHAAATGEGFVADTTPAGSSVWIDLDAPDTALPAGPAVAARVAAALYDLVDGANEATDGIDGSGAAADRVLATVDAMTTIPTADLFAEAWAAAGHDGFGLSRNFVAAGVYLDDAWEPNDVPSESSAPVPAGTRRDGLVLTPWNEDWTYVTLAEPVAQLVADVGSPGLAFDAPLELQFLDLGGTVLAGLSDPGTRSFASVTTGPLAAGTYRVRVRHVGGSRIPAYTVQAAPPLVLGGAPLRAWTAGFAYEHPLPYAGGVGTVSFSAADGTPPAGIVLDASKSRAAGTPQTPGKYLFTLVVQDSGRPQHSVRVPQTVVIAEPLKFGLHGWLALPLGRPYAAVRVPTGGTRPFTVELVEGSLPDGVSLDPGDLRFTGTADAEGWSGFTVRATDAAGSSHTESARAVVCVPLGATATTLALGEGDAACGGFVDGVAGSALSVTVKTAPKAAKRTLAAALVGPDGSPVPGAKIRGGKGKATVRAVLPATGRYFVVLSSASGSATTLAASGRASPPRSAGGSFAQVTPPKLLDLTFGAVAGTRADLRLQPAKKVGLSLAYVFLERPDGTSVPLAGLTSRAGPAFRLRTVLDQSGTWRVRARAEGGGTTTVKWRCALAPPKGAVHSED